MGLELDTGEQSRIYELKPNHAEYIADTDEPTFFTRLMIKFGTYRLPGPEHLYEVDKSALRRWHDNPERLQDRKPYRPKTLTKLETQIKALDAVKLGVGDKIYEAMKKEPCRMYRVRPDEVLSVLAVRFYGTAKAVDRIVAANPLIDNPDVIFAGEILRIPKKGLIEGAFERS